MASLAPLPLQPPRVLDQKVENFTQQQQQQQQQQHQEQQKQQQQQQQQQQQNNNQEPLRCPRCDSSNTKFCYYNNYSLSQPRHFCKACKRYWTRGGTLRSVPVGGGCRKNKRVKRPLNNNNNNSNNNSSSMITTNNITNNNNNNNNYSTNLHDGSVNSLPSTNNNSNNSNINTHIHDLINSSTSNSLFYGINHGSNHNLMNNFPFSRYDLHNPSQINGLGLGFSSGLVHNDNINGDYRNPHNNNNNNNNNKHIFQDLISSNPTTSSSISSLLAPSFQMKSGANYSFETILPSYEGSLHMKGGMYMKEVKMELEGQNRAMDHHWSAPSQNLLDQNNVGSSPSHDPSHVWGNGPHIGNTWLDPSHNNLGSSFPSLI